MKLVFFGSGAFGLPSLRRLAEVHDIAAVVTQPDRPAGRGGALSPTPIATWAMATPGLTVLKPEKVNDPAVVGDLRSRGADAWVVIAFGQKLGPRLLDGVFAVNLHASRLPRWRGAAPINAAILAGDTVTGNSVITLADRMDAGDCLTQSSRPIDPLTTAGELHDLLAEDGPALLEGVLSDIARKSASRTPQDEAQVTLAPKLSKADGWVDFSETAESCRRRIHGLTPWPGVTVGFRDQPVKLSRVRIAPGASDQAPGTVTDAEQGLVACTGSMLQVLEVHPSGRNRMQWADFARGQRVRSGEQLFGGKPQ